MKPSKKQHLNLLCDVGDLASLVAGSGDIESFLQQTVEMVACHLNADVGSIYLYDNQSSDLVLKATVGLNPGAVNTVRMKAGEGLVGLTFVETEPMREGRASRHPRFKYFEEAEEERFESFMSVPIRRGQETIGVLVVQDEKADYFSGVDMLALKAIASQLAGAVENARLFMDLNGAPAAACPAEDRVGPRFVKGESIMGGYAHAPAVVLQAGHDPLMASRPDEAFHCDREALAGAWARTKRQLEALQKRLHQRLPESAALIFEAHFMILKDPRFLGRVDRLMDSGSSAPAAVRAAALETMARFQASDSAYLREKADDVADLSRRILHNLLRQQSEDPTSYQGRVVVARRLYPSQMLKLASEDVAGVVLVNAGLTAHVAIIARSLKVPMVVADRPDLVDLPPLTPVLLDAEIGNVYVDPSARIVDQFEQRNAAREAAPPPGAGMAMETATADGHRVHLLANINLLSELELAKAVKAEGVGLYRTEFPFMARAELPSEEEQFWVYRRFFDSMPGGRNDHPNIGCGR
jgi:phosphotransferase system enzyme I (PtsP)